jgi:vacuolar-type H+-ATPase subunit E/Vma4
MTEVVNEPAGAPHPNGSAPAVEGPAKGDISRRITAILDAAQEEAEKIREAAREEAASIVRNAHASAAERIDELTREPQRLKDEAARAASEILESAEAEATVRITKAEREAAEMIRLSHEDAETRRKETDHAVAETEELMERRRQQLESEIQSLVRLREMADASIQKVVDGLQAVASEIGGLLSAVPDSERAAQASAAETDSSESGRTPQEGKGARRFLSRRSGEE